VEFFGFGRVGGWGRVLRGGGDVWGGGGVYVWRFARWVVWGGMRGIGGGGGGCLEEEEGGGLDVGVGMDGWIGGWRGIGGEDGWMVSMRISWVCITLNR